VSLHQIHRKASSVEDQPPYEIQLIFEGNSVHHRVWPTMPIAQLMMEAGSIFGLDPYEKVLLLFTLQPVTLRKDATISGPPHVTLGSKVVVFSVSCVAYTRNYSGPGHGNYPAPPGNPPQLFSSKLLGSFKLPKFDGVAKSWKA
jgi:hypothetical protein